jgi:hypothetical protein
LPPPPATLAVAVAVARMAVTLLPPSPLLPPGLSPPLGPAGGLAISLGLPQGQCRSPI